MTCGEPQGHHKDPNWGVPASGYHALGFSYVMQKIFGSEVSSSTDSRTAFLSQKSPSCSRWRPSHPNQHPPPQTQRCKCTDRSSPPSSSLQGTRPGSPGARLPPACLWRELGPSSAPATCDTYCCRIMGILTQLAAATAAKGTQRATKGGARCRKQAGISTGEQDVPSCPSWPWPGIPWCRG